MFLRIEKAAAHLGVSVPTLYRWGYEGLLPRPTKLGPNASGYSIEVLDAFIAERAAASARESEQGEAGSDGASD